MRSPASLRVVLATAVVVVSSVPVAEGQRVKARLEHRKRAVELECGVVRYGSHSLDELAPGGEWRLGSNTASTIVVEAPLVAGTTVVPTGSYRVKLRRGTDLEFQLMIEGAGYELGGGAALYLDGTYAEEDDPADKLDVRWIPRDAAQDEDESLRPAALEVRFGPHTLTVPAALVRTAPVRVSGWRFDAYEVPAAVLEARRGRSDATVVASLERKGRAPKDAPAAFNLLVSDDEAVLLPAQVAPTDSYGFGAVQPPPDAWTFRGTVEWRDAQKETPRCEVDDVELTEGKQLRVTLRCGAKEAVVLVDAPLRPRRQEG